MSRQHVPSDEGRAINMWLSDPLPDQVARSLDRLARTDDVQHLAVMPDVHLSYNICVGVALATNHLIYPAAVGSDIGCGIASVQLAAQSELLREQCRAAEVLAGLYRRVPVNRQAAHNAVERLPQHLLDLPLSHSRLERMKQRDARVQLGTLGRGNHFLEIQVDPEDWLWLTVHSGSRGVGQAITAHHTCHVSAANTGLKRLDATKAEGRAYLNDLNWAIAYAQLNRLTMLHVVVDLLGERFGVDANWDTLIHTHHDHVRREMHFDQEYWVHRKGAQAAYNGEQGIVPGSMGTATYHIQGRGCPASLQSCSHGAGRVMSRSDARRTIGRSQLLRQMQSVWFDHRRAEALRDEAPDAYKQIDRVMRAQRDLVKIVRKLTPLLNYKGA